MSAPDMAGRFAFIFPFRSVLPATLQSFFAHTHGKFHTGPMNQREALPASELSGSGDRAARIP